MSWTRRAHPFGGWKDPGFLPVEWGLGAGIPGGGKCLSKCLPAYARRVLMVLERRWAYGKAGKKGGGKFECQPNARRRDRKARPFQMTTSGTWSIRSSRAYIPT